MNPFLDYYWPFAHGVQFGTRKSPRKGETGAVVLYHHFPFAVMGSQPHQHLLGTAVLADVDQPFLYDSDQFPANLLGHVQFSNIGDKTRRDAGLALKSFHRISKKSQKSLGVH